MSSVLNDEELWHVSSTDSEDEESGQTDRRNNDDYFVDPEEEVARFLVESTLDFKNLAAGRSKIKINIKDEKSAAKNRKFIL